MHQRVKRLRGKAASCDRCGATDAERMYDWAFNGVGNKSDINDYIPMCRKCHWKFDADLHPRGERNGLAKLTDAIVRTCREHYAAGTSCASLAREFGVGKQAMWAAVTRRTWKHVG